MVDAIIQDINLLNLNEEEIKQQEINNKCSSKDVTLLDENKRMIAAKQDRMQQARQRELADRIQREVTQVGAATDETQMLNFLES